MTYTPGRIIRRVGRPPSALSAWALTPLVQPKRADEVYTTAIVVASTEFEAQHLHPDSELRWSATMDSWVDSDGECWNDGAWPDPKHVRATRLGAAPPTSKAGEVVGYHFIQG
jgi:hypothetical protein